jgi:hypothetical protein
MSKIKKSARGKPCQLRLDECVSGGQNETTVFAHLNSGGMGRKENDLFGMYACHVCHNIIDGRQPHDYEREWLELVQLRAMKRTQEILLKEENVRCY